MDGCKARKCITNPDLSGTLEKWNDFVRCSKKIYNDGFCEKWTNILRFECEDTFLLCGGSGVEELSTGRQLGFLVEFKIYEHLVLLFGVGLAIIMVAMKHEIMVIAYNAGLTTCTAIKKSISIEISYVLARREILFPILLSEMFTQCQHFLVWKHKKNIEKQRKT